MGTYLLIGGIVVAIVCIMVVLVRFGRSDEEAWMMEAMAEEEEEADFVYGDDDVPPLR